MFRTVWALPNASRIGFARKICWESVDNCLAPERTYGVSDVATAARYWMTFFVFSVFPAPDSPLHGYQDICHLVAQVRTHLRDEDALVFAFFHQIAECFICHGKDMWPCLLSAATFVGLDVFVGVDG